MSIVLIGYRGSGKTSVGQKLADRLWQELIDTDQLVTQRAGMTIREIFERQGEPAFRDLEADVVKEALRLPDAVISLGGGAVLRDDTRAALAAGGHKVIYLRCDPAELHRRIHADQNTAESRPSLSNLGGTLAEIEALLAQREPIYRTAMTAELDVTHLTVDEAVVYIVRLL